MKKLILALLLAITIACFAPGSYVKFGNGGKIVPEEIVENWDLVGEQCVGKIMPNDCPGTVLHVHQQYYQNPDPEAEITKIIIGIDKDTGSIVTIEFYDKETRYVFGKLCGRTDWKQYIPNPNKTVSLTDASSV